MSNGFAGSSTRAVGGVEREIESRLSAEEKHTTTIAVMNQGRLLMGKRRDNGLWTMPGGGMNEGEDPHGGAVRELYEETGIRANELESLGSSKVEGRSGRSVNVHCFYMAADGDLNAHAHNDPDDEIEAWTWIDTHTGLPAEIKTNLHSPKNVLLKKLSLLSDDDFREVGPGGDTSKAGDNQKPHDDMAPEADPAFTTGQDGISSHAANQLDALTQAIEGRIKSESEQFPGAK